MKWRNWFLKVGSRKVRQLRWIFRQFFSMEKKQLQSKAFMPGKVYTRFVFYRKKQVLIRIV